MTALDTHAAKTLLYDTAANSYTLAMGLQNAAPPQENGKPVPSVQYLLESAIQLKQAAQRIDDVLPIKSQEEQQIKLAVLIREALQGDEALRKKYHIVDRFRFVRDRLMTLLNQLDKNLIDASAKQPAVSAMTGKESVVYVYLYNVEGSSLRSWQTMLTPKVFYEYSVNRPIYSEKKYLDDLLRLKKNKLHHAYLTVAVDPTDLLSSTQTDALGNPLVKVKEGALSFTKLVAFTHNDQDYSVDEKGEFIRKNQVP